VSMFVGRIQKLIGNIGPWYVHGTNIGRFLETFGIVLDDAMTTLQIGLSQAYPLECDRESLTTIAYDRSMRFYGTEPEESTRYRLSRWLQLHRQRGTHQGELRHAQLYFYPNAPVMRIVHQDGAGSSATWHTLNAAGEYSVYRKTPSNWNYDGATSRWGRFWVILYPPTGFLSGSNPQDNLAHYGGTHSGGYLTAEMVYGGYYTGGHISSLRNYDGLSTAVLSDLVDMIREWSRRREMLWGYIVAIDSGMFDPASTSVTMPSGYTTMPIGNWGSPMSSTGVRTRPPGALWVYDKGQG
jgi:hypothetical protein